MKKIRTLKGATLERYFRSSLKLKKSREFKREIILKKINGSLFIEFR